MLWRLMKCCDVSCAAVAAAISARTTTNHDEHVVATDLEANAPTNREDRTIEDRT